MKLRKNSYWLTSVGAGWKDLVDPLIRMCEAAEVEILQIKEKFGGLRFYVGSCPEDIQKEIQDAENKSYSICEVCGEPGKVGGRGWVKTLCDAHHEQRKVNQRGIDAMLRW